MSSELSTGENHIEKTTYKIWIKSTEMKGLECLPSLILVVDYKVISYHVNVSKNNIVL